MSAGAPRPPDTSAGYERTDADVPRMSVVLAGLLLVAALSTLAMAALFQVLAKREAVQPPPASLAGRAPQEPPPPRLQTTPFGDWKKMRAEEDEKQTTYAWIDETRGSVRLPIERAIDLIVERGVPTPAGDASHPPAAAAGAAQGAPVPGEKPAEGTKRTVGGKPAAGKKRTPNANPNEGGGR